MKHTLLLSVCFAAVVSVAAATIPLGERFERAYAAWDSGDHVRGLEGFKAVLTAPGGGAYFERIALATGELHRVTELTTDGRQPRFSADGRYLS